MTQNIGTEGKKRRGNWKVVINGTMSSYSLKEGDWKNLKTSGIFLNLKETF